MKFGSTLSTDLRERYKRRSARPRVGDSAKIVRGEFKGIEGKITQVDGRRGKLTIEGVTREKIKGGTANIPVDPSNVVITNIVLDDKLRKKKLGGE